MLNRRVLALVGILLVGAVTGWSQQSGYILKSGEGERLPGERQTIVKASPRTGTQGVELFRDSMPPGLSTGIHVHQQADEFFYVVRGTGVGLVDGKEMPLAAEDVIFVPKGHDHRVTNNGPSPLELVFFVDRSGLASDFREGRGAQLAKGRRLTLDEWNSISQKFGTTHKTID